MSVNNEVNEFLENNNYSSKSTTNRSRNGNNYNKYHNRNYNNRKNNRNNFVEQQNHDRQVIYDTMDRMALVVGNDSQKFQEYLDVQSRFEKYSVGNCLVILQNSPNSTQIKDEQSWNEKGVNLKRNPKSIKILEPVKSSNGNIYYNPKEVYDISQTDSPKQRMIDYGDRKLLEALYDWEVSKKAVYSLENGEIGAKYNAEENVLYVCMDMDRELLFRTLLQEIAKIEMKDERDSNIKEFRSYCISYMMCKKYGIDVTDFNFEKIPPEIANQREGKEIRSELGAIKSNFEEIDTKLANYLRVNEKEKSKSVPER